MSITENIPLNWYSSMKKEKDSDNFWHSDKKKLWKSDIFHSIKIPFDAKVDEKFLNVT